MELDLPIVLLSVYERHWTSWLTRQEAGRAKDSEEKVVEHESINLQAWEFRKFLAHSKCASDMSIITKKASQSVGI